MARISESRMSDDAYRDLLAGLFALIWIALAIAPLYRHDWMLENALVVVGAGFFLWWRKSIQLSKLSMTLVFVFLVLHEIGAHYTYSEVPYNGWTRALFGTSLNDLLGLQRNHFDRLVHFSYGFLLAYPMREIYMRKGWLHGRLTYTFPVVITLGVSALFEMLEWGAAVTVGSELGTAYLGTQGDVWDAQKDMALAGLGATITMIATFLTLRKNPPAWETAVAPR
jgi:putative membrane protein